MAPISTPTKRPRLAAVVTAYKKIFHPEEVLDRFFEGYGWNGAFYHPAMDVVSLYVDQRGPGDIFQDRVDRHPYLKVYPTVADAVTLGTGKLAVDGVIAVGEHGTYAMSPNGIMMHPHYEFFEQVVKVFRDSGRSVPYFNDKELSWKWEWCKAMVDTSHELGFPLQGGSSLAVTWRIPSVEFPLGATAHEAVGIGYGGETSYDFHVLETIQCMVERRKGGETGVEWVQTYRGDAFWKACEDGVWSQALMKAALSRSVTLTPSGSFTEIFPTIEQMKKIALTPVAYHYQHRDGLRCTMLLLNGLVRDFTFAANIEGQAKPFSTQMYLPMPDAGRTTLASFFSPLMHNAQEMFLTGKAQYPIERTLMTSGLLIAGVDSARSGERLQTPNLAAVQYQPNPESTFWRS